MKPLELTPALFIVLVAFSFLMTIVMLSEWDPEEPDQQRDLHAMRVWLVMIGLILAVMVLAEIFVP